jgi:hypothetical protein
MDVIIDQNYRENQKEDYLENNMPYMMKKNYLIFNIVLVFLVLFTGCVDFVEEFSTREIIYESHPTKIRYHVNYGYQIKLNGFGSSTITYREDFPDILNGIIMNLKIHNQLNAEIQNIDENEMIVWNETFFDKQNIFLGITADIISESTVIQDLNGSNGLTFTELEANYPTYIRDYCNIQGNITKILIDPSNSQIKQIALDLRNQLNSENIFQLAKELFIWLKTNTEYQFHIHDQQIQTCDETYHKKTGDCDDLSFLYISLCRAVSIPSRFIRGFLITNQDNNISLTPHVWVEIFVGNNFGNTGWIPVECAGTGSIDAEVHQNFGVEDAQHLRLYIDDGSNASMNRYTNRISVKYETGLTVEILNRANITGYQVLESQKLCISNNMDRRYC